MQEEVKAVDTLKMCRWQKNYFGRQRDDHLFHLTVRQLSMESIFIKYSDCFTQTHCSEDTTGSKSGSGTWEIFMCCQ